MDFEIMSATTAGLHYWAFLYFDPKGVDRQFLKGWQLYQASKHKRLLNWCWIYNYESLVVEQFNNFRGLVSQMKDPSYETVFSRKPLLYVMPNGIDQAAGDYRLVIKNLRLACLRAGVSEPYITVMGNIVDMEAMGADAVSDYAYAPQTEAGSYHSLVEAVESFWNVRAELGAQMIPVCMTGWDRRPRIERPVPWEAGRQKPGVGLTNFYEPGLPGEIANHVSRGLNWVIRRSDVAAARHLLIYSWNEFDEGGWLCPTWSRSGPVTSRLDALRKASLNRRSAYTKLLRGMKRG